MKKFPFWKGRWMVRNKLKYSVDSSGNGAFYFVNGVKALSRHALKVKWTTEIFYFGP